jgi:non-homologous end joining protein Ku
MARAIRKGAISFGLVHIPVSLLPALSTQTIDIFAFVETGAIPWINFYKPYFLSPGRRGEKVVTPIISAFIGGCGRC